MYFFIEVVQESLINVDVCMDPCTYVCYVLHCSLDPLDSEGSFTSLQFFGREEEGENTVG